MSCFLTHSCVSMSSFIILRVFQETQKQSIKLYNLPFGTKYICSNSQVFLTFSSLLPISLHYPVVDVIYLHYMGLGQMILKFLPRPFCDSVLFLQCHSLILAYKWSQYSFSLPFQVAISVVFSQHSSPCLPEQTKYHRSAYAPLCHHGENASGLLCTWSSAAYRKISLDELASW